MSNQTYLSLHAQTLRLLTILLDSDTPQQNLTVRDYAHQVSTTTTLYIKYVMIFNALQSAHDLGLQPQRRRGIKEVMLNVMGRMLEIKAAVIDLTSTPYPKLLDALLQLQLSPSDVQIPIPNFFKEERQELVPPPTKTITFADTTEKEAEMTIEEAVAILQNNERARQGRARAKYLRDLRKSDHGQEVISDSGKAATKIQKIARGYITRKMMKAMRANDQLFLNMTASSASPQMKLAQENSARRKEMQATWEEEYISSLVTIKEKVTKLEGPDMKERIQDSFRQWYLDYKRETGIFPEFPSDEDFAKPDFMFGMDKKEVSIEASSPKKDAKKEAAKPPSPAKPDKAKKGAEPVAVVKSTTSIYLDGMMRNLKTYTKEWENKDESANFAQKHDPEITKIAKRKEVESEVKDTLAQSLKDELKVLKSAMNREKSAEAVGDKKGAKKEKKPEAEKPKKDKKEGGAVKKTKDMTADRTTESLVEELVTCGIIQKCPDIQMGDLLGEEPLSSVVSKTSGSIPELQRAITELCILPLGLEPPEGASSPFTPSVLLYGPKGTGKSHLLLAAAAQCKAAFFNLSPSNTAGLYQGKALVTKMLHMVFKLAKLLAPSIIYFDEAEQIFAKKGAAESKRIRKELGKYMDSITPSDRIVVIAETNKPWEADKTMQTQFSKVLGTELPDYATRERIWRCKIVEQIGVEKSSEIIYPMLAKFSEGFSVADLIKTVNKVLSTRRVIAIKFKPLKTDEFLNNLQMLAPVSPEDLAQFKEFAEQLPMYQKWLSIKAMAEAEKAAQDKPKKDDKKAKKK